MGLDKAVRIFAAMHAGFGIAQIAVTYFMGGVAYYGGAAGFLSGTPLSGYFGAGQVDSSGWRVANILDLKSMFGHLVQLGDTVFGLLSFEYEMLTSVAPADGFVYWVALLFRIITWLATMTVTLALLRLVFSSGILQSQTGLLLVLSGVGGIGALATLGALN